ncbi:hypothetical protein CKAN_00026100 [Cinnamomum micranthum f. kanehirae]|uniref:DUF7950 domain-containing protein n=1 Tax=Cinnamomum micranthum f. kanehirae TaxID=337451 RepID=A0A443N0P1_9MAGN|nr:hypothetical protein CKAN_00026100 [Cinnamomum micranthum f. kanehirae]
MDGRGGGCCVARYGGGGSMVDRIMLRFRPIAPKPATGGSAPGTIAYDSRKADPPPKTTRSAKRRCVRERKASCGASAGKKRRSSSEEKQQPDVAVVTLPLLPETPDRKEPSQSPPSDLSSSPLSDLPIRSNPITIRKESTDPVGLVLTPQPVRPVGSWVTLERVTGTCLGGSGVVSTEKEEIVVRSLDSDTCPAFVSDGWNRVTWTNDAYRRMVGGGEGEEVVVGLAFKDEIPETLRGFSCRVRVQYTCRKERHSMTVPCDVWRMMRCGGFAWRLDMKAALSLGR